MQLSTIYVLQPYQLRGHVNFNSFVANLAKECNLQICSYADLMPTLFTIPVLSVWNTWATHSLVFEFVSQQILSSFFTEVACEICDVLQVISITDAKKMELYSKFC